MKKKMNIPIFIAHQGCPNDCVFCNQKRITGFRDPFNEIQIRKQIESYLEGANTNKSIEIAFFGGSFTGIDREIQKKYLELATEYVVEYNLDGIRMSTRPDYISEQILLFLQSYPVKAIELGVQSLDEEVLHFSNRGHSVEQVYKAVEYIQGMSFELGLQMMIGLPKDTKKKAIETAEKIISMDPKTVRIYPTVIMKDTELEQMYFEEEYTPLTIEEAIDWTVGILPLFYQKEIEVIRVGLQASEEVDMKGGIVAGPYHPAFRQLVEEKILHEYILAYYRKQKEFPLQIFANQRIYQNLIGHKKRYREAIQAQNLPIEFILDSSIENDELKLISDHQEKKVNRKDIMKGGI